MNIENRITELEKKYASKFIEIDTQDNLRKAFKQFDTHNKDTISACEIRHVMANSGKNYSEIEVEEMIRLHVQLRLEKSTIKFHFHRPSSTGIMESK